MFERWLSNPPKKGPITYKVVEVDPSKRFNIKADKDVLESIATLNHHPGFLYLVKKLELQAGLLKSKLNGERHKDLEAVQFLQAGIFWSGFFQREANAAMSRPTERQVDPFEEEMKAFKELDAMVERVGQ